MVSQPLFLCFVWSVTDYSLPLQRSNSERIMKRTVLSLLLALVAVTAIGQTLTQRKTIKSINFGVLKLEQITQASDTAYAMLIKTTNRYQKHITVALGDRANAIRLLRLLCDVKLKNDDMLDLENPTHNIVTRGTFGSLRFHSEGRQFQGDCGKMYLKTFLDVLEGRTEPADEVEQTDGD